MHDMIIHAHDIIIRTHEIIIHSHDIIIREHEIIIWALDLISRANEIRIHALDIIIRTHEIIIRFQDIIIWAHNLTIYVNWLVYSSDSITKKPNGHVSLTWVYVVLYKYVSVGNWQSRLLTYTYSSSTGHICLYYFLQKVTKTISAQPNLNSNQQLDWFELYDDLQESSRTKKGRKQRSGVGTRFCTTLPTLMFRIWISQIGHCQFRLQWALLTCCWR